MTARMLGLNGPTRLRGLTPVEESAPFVPDLVNPWEPFDGPGSEWWPAGLGFRGFGLPRERTGSHQPAPAGMLTEQELRASIVWSRWLCERNPLAVGFLGHLRNFVYGDGASWKVTLRGADTGATTAGLTDADGDGRPDVDPDVKACQQFLDEWRKYAGWGESADHFDYRDLDGPDRTSPSDRQAEAGLRAFRDGNAVVRFWAGGSGDDYLPSVRFVDPELIRNPAGDLRDGDGRHLDANGDWGVVTDPDDPEKRLGMWLIDPANPSHGEFVPAGRLAHLKVNVDGTVKLGVPDFFCVQDGLEDVRKLLRNMGEAGVIQAAIAWIAQHSPGTTETQVRAMIEQNKTYAYNRPELGGGVTRQTVKRMDGATSLNLSNGQQLLPGPTSTGAAQFVQVEQAILRATGMRFGMPEYFSGDGSNANYASTLVSGGPAEKAFKRRQKDVKAFEQSVAMRVLAFGVRAGRLTPEQVRRVTVEVTFPGVAIADKDKDTARRVSLVDKNLMSPQTAMAEEGLDPTVEAANVKAWKTQFPDPAAVPVTGTPTGGPPTLESWTREGVELAEAGWRVTETVEALVADGLTLSEATHYVASEHPRDKNGRFIDKGDIDAARAAYAKGDKAPAEALRAKVRPQDLELLNTHLSRADAHAGDARAFHPSAQKAGHLRSLGWSAAGAVQDHVGKYLDTIADRGPLTPEERRDLVVGVTNLVRSKRVPELGSILRGIGVSHGEFAGKSKEQMQGMILDRVKAAVFDFEVNHHAKAADPERQPAHAGA